MGHARALITIPDPVVQLELYNKVIREGLSVRKVEALVKKRVEEESKSDKKTISPKTMRKTSEEFDVLKQHLSRFFNTQVEFKYSKSGKGKISIPFDSNEELERIIGIFDVIKK